jgi:hypothetical protein
LDIILTSPRIGKVSPEADEPRVIVFRRFCNDPRLEEELPEEGRLELPEEGRLELLEPRLELLELRGL